MNNKSYSKTAMSSFIITIVLVFIIIIWLNTKINIESFLVVAIIGAVLSIAAIILGIFGIIVIRKNKEKYKGIWAGITGILLAITFIISAVYILFVIMKYAVFYVR